MKAAVAAVRAVSFGDYVELTKPRITTLVVATTLAGIGYLFVFVNLLTALLAACTSALYLFAYTPLKTRTSLCTIVGAVPGAIPPVIGWTAVQNNLGFEAGWLFAVLFLWQLPHFLAI